MELGKFPSWTALPAGAGARELESTGGIRQFGAPRGRGRKNLTKPNIKAALAALPAARLGK